MLSKSLVSFYLGGLTFLDESKPDEASFLDVLASTLIESACSKRREGFFHYYAVGCLARSLASSSIRCDCGVKAMKRRLKSANKLIWMDVSSSAICCMQRKCKNADELASIVIQVCRDDNIENSVDCFDFEMLLEKLREIRSCHL
jgi:hypothetical protein